MAALTEDELLLNFRETQEFLRASRSKVYRLISSGELVAHKVGRTWLFYKRDLQSLVSRHRYQSGNTRSR